MYHTLALTIYWTMGIIAYLAGASYTIGLYSSPKIGPTFPSVVFGLLFPISLPFLAFILGFVYATELMFKYVPIVWQLIFGNLYRAGLYAAGKGKPHDS